MTHMQLIAVVAPFAALLLAIGWGVWRILRHTSFVASIVARNVAEQDDESSHESSQEPVAAEQDDDDGTRPIGFGARLRERN